MVEPRLAPCGLGNCGCGKLLPAKKFGRSGCLFAMELERTHPERRERLSSAGPRGAPKHVQVQPPNQKAKTSRRHLKFKRIALLEKLEVREVPAISIIGTEIRIAGSELNDQVSISPGTRGLGQIVVTHTRIGTGGSTTESRTFALASVASIGVALGNGDNTFVNQTSLPSKVMGGLGADTFTAARATTNSLVRGQRYAQRTRRQRSPGWR